MHGRQTPRVTGRYRALLRRCAVQGLSWLLRGLYITLRPVVVQPQFEHQVCHAGGPMLLTFWHGRMVYFIYRYRFQRFTVLVSESRDGEWIAGVLARFGIHATRGSSSRGGARALLEIRQRMRQGFHVGMTPDGPRGPRYHVQPGLLLLAKKTGAPILPASYSARWKTVLHTWDRFLIPWPFSRVVVVYGEPVYVPADASTALLQSKLQEVEGRLRDLTEIADHYFREPR